MWILQLSYLWNAPPSAIELQNLLQSRFQSNSYVSLYPQKNPGVLVAPSQCMFWQKAWARNTLPFLSCRWWKEACKYSISRVTHPLCQNPPGLPPGRSYCWWEVAWPNSCSMGWGAGRLESISNSASDFRFELKHSKPGALNQGIMNSHTAFPYCDMDEGSWLDRRGILV